MASPEQAEIIARRNHCLPSIISSLTQDEEATKYLEKIKMCMEYLPTYSLSEADRELFQWTLPMMKQALSKIFDDNSLLSGTRDDDFVLELLKHNLKIALEFMSIEKLILEFVTEHNNVKLKEISSVSVHSVEIIILTFKHCKDSTETYKTAFNVELLELFRLTQEVHCLFLKLVESCIRIEDAEDVDVTILTEVLDRICNISQVLADMNMKSLTTNWKSYTAILQKFANIIEDKINLVLPIQHLATEILENFKNLDNFEIFDSARSTQIVKLINFLIKVALKIFDVFWDNLIKIKTELVEFSFMILSFSPDCSDYPPKFLDLIENYIFNAAEPLFYRFTQSSFILEVLSDYRLTEQWPFGRLRFLNIYLNSFVENESKDYVDINILINGIFESVKLCFADFCIDANPSRNIFDNLVLDISRAVMMFPESYSDVETMLLKHILQEHIWCSLLATEIWCLLLSTAPPQFRQGTLMNLLRIHEKLDFGINTSRLEYVHFRNLVLRVFKLLPVNFRIDICNHLELTENLRSWTVIGLKYFPDKRPIEHLCMKTMDNVSRIGQTDYSLNDFTYLVENLELLSTVDYQELDVSLKNLANVVSSFWELNFADLTNNIFRYFIDKLCKLTAALILEFNNKQLFTILNQLRILSSDDYFKISVCKILYVLAYKNFNELGQDGYRVSLLVSHEIHPSLRSTTNPIIKQLVLEILENFVKSDKQDIVRDIMKTSQDLQSEITNYLHKNINVNEIFGKEYYSWLEQVKFKHQCIKWKLIDGTHANKKIKIDEFVLIDPNIPKDKVSKVNPETEITKSNKTDPVHGRRTSLVTSSVTSPQEEANNDTVTEAISNIKGEVKCLMNILKTEKMSAKHVADLRLIANQLLSLM